MTAHAITITVLGTPAPQGSKKAFALAGNRARVVDVNPKALNTWREDVKYAAERALAVTAEWERDYPAIVGYFAFCFDRPRSHYRTGKFADLLRDDAPDYHAKMPDLDKLLRSTWDALTAAGVYRDDSRVSQVSATKTYTGQGPRQLDKPGAVITLYGMKP